MWKLVNASFLVLALQLAAQSVLADPALKVSYNVDSGNNSVDDVTFTATITNTGDQDLQVSTVLFLSINPRTPFWSTGWLPSHPLSIPV
jgi:hypothetical protein